MCIYTTHKLWEFGDLARVWTDATVEEKILILINEGVRDDHCQLVNTPCALITVPQLVTN